MSRLSSIAYKGIYSPYISFIPVSVLNISTSTNAVNEGTALTFTVATRNAVTSTTLYWTINSTTTNISDFSSLSGSFTVTSNSGSFSITPLEDVLTEGIETFTVSIRSDSITGIELIRSQVITINDTSVATYSLTRSVASVNEGSSFTITFATNQSGSLPYTITGISTGDIGGASLTGSITNGQVLTFNVTADLSAEGTESFTIALNNGLASTSVTINDTSVSTVPALATIFTPVTSSNSTVLTATGVSIPSNTMIVAFVAWEVASAVSTGTAVSITNNSGGLTWSRRATLAGYAYGDLASAQRIEVWWAINNTGSTINNNTITYTNSATWDDATMTIHIFSGVNLTTPWRTSTSGSQTGIGSTVPYATLTTDTTNSLAIMMLTRAYFTNNGSFVLPPNSNGSWTLISNPINPGGTRYSYGYIYNATYSTTTSNVNITRSTWPVEPTPGTVNSSGWLTYIDALRGV